MTTTEPAEINKDAPIDLKRKQPDDHDDAHQSEDEAHDEKHSDANENDARSAKDDNDDGEDAINQSSDAEAKPKKQRKPRAKKQKFDATFHVGDEAPNVSVMTDTGEQVAFRELLENKRVIVFVFPKANTPGCTTQGTRYVILHVF